MVRRLLLLRHATTEGDVPEGDFARRLTEGGEAEARSVGERLAAAEVGPDVILHSTAVRATATAQLVVEAAGGALAAVPLVPVDALYLASPRALLAVLQQHGGDHAHVMVVAHNPGLSDLAHLLMHSAEDEAAVAVGQGMRPATLVQLRFDTPGWTDLLDAGHVERCQHAG